MEFQWMISQDESILVQGCIDFCSNAYKITSDQVDVELSQESDHLKKYFTHSPESSQLFQILLYQQHSNCLNLETLIIDLLSLTIVSSKLLNARSNGNFIIKSIARDHMKWIYRNLSSGKNALIQSTLNLLISMASHGSNTTLDLQSTFDFNLSCIDKILKSRKKTSASYEFENYRKETPIRTLYIQFILALMRKGEATVRQSLIECGDLLGSILMGLHLDSMELIDSVFIMILKNILEFDGISRNAKLLFFNNKNLDRLLKLYSIQTSNEGEGVCDLVHALLLQICTIPGKGVCYKDSGYYPPSTKNVKIYNKILSSFIEHLNPLDNVLQLELLLAILQASPELVKPYGQMLYKYSWDQFDHPKWFFYTDLLCKIISLPVPNGFGAVSSTPPPIPTVLESILPKCWTRTVCSKALQNGNPLIQTTATLVLCRSFEKLNKVLEEIVLKTSHSDKSNSETRADTNAQLSQEWTLFKTELLNQFRKRLVDFQILLVALNSNIQNQQNDFIATRNLLKLIISFQELDSNFFMEIRFNPVKVYTRDISIYPHDLQEMILKLLLQSQDFKWNSQIPSSDYSYLLNLLQFYISCDSFKSLIKNVVLYLLNQSYPFDHSKEVYVWMSTLELFSMNDQGTIIRFIDLVFKRVVEMASFTLTNKNSMFLLDFIPSAVMESLDHLIVTKFIYNLIISLFKVNLINNQQIMAFFTDYKSPLWIDIQNRVLKVVDRYSLESCNDVDSMDCDEDIFVTGVECIEMEKIKFISPFHLFDYALKEFSQSVSTTSPKGILLNRILNQDLLDSEIELLTCHILLESKIRLMHSCKENLEILKYTTSLLDAIQKSFNSLDFIQSKSFEQYTALVFDNGWLHKQDLYFLFEWYSTLFKSYPNVFQHLWTRINQDLRNQIKDIFSFKSLFILFYVSGDSMSLDDILYSLIAHPFKSKSQRQEMYNIFEFILDVTPKPYSISCACFEEISNYSKDVEWTRIRWKVVSFISQTHDLPWNSCTGSQGLVILEENSKHVNSSLWNYINVSDISSWMQSDCIYEFKLYCIWVHCHPLLFIDKKTPETFENQVILYSCLLTLSWNEAELYPLMNEKYREYLKHLWNSIHPILIYKTEFNLDMDLFLKSIQLFGLDNKSLKEFISKTSITTCHELINNNPKFDLEILFVLLAKDINACFDHELDLKELSFCKMSIHHLCDSLAVHDLSKDILQEYPLQVSVQQELQSLTQEHWEILEVLFQFSLEMKIDLGLEVILKQLFRDLDTILIHKPYVCLVNILLMCMKQNPLEYCQPIYLNSFLSIFNGSASRLDESILSILFIYEQQIGISVMDVILDVWAGHDLSKLDATRMIFTLQNFPFDSFDSFPSCKSTSIKTDEEYTHRFTEYYPIYNLNFFLPFIASLVETYQQRQLDSSLFFQSNLVGIVILCLSSKKQSTRKVALLLLSKLEQILVNSQSKDKSQLELLFESLKNAIVIEKDTIPRIPTLITSFIAQSCMILQRPDSYLFPLVNRFLLQRPLLDVRDVPMFYELFFSTNDNFKKERLWVLKLLCSGVACFDDYQVLKRRHVWDILSSYYHSSVSDAYECKLILQLLDRMLSIPSVRADLISKTGLLNFLNSCLVKYSPAVDPLNIVIVSLQVKILENSDYICDLYPCIQGSLLIYLKRILQSPVVDSSCPETINREKVILFTLNALYEIHALLANVNQGSLPLMDSNLILQLMKSTVIGMDTCMNFTLNTEKVIPSDLSFDLLLHSYNGPSFQQVLLQLILHSVVDCTDSFEFYAILEWTTKQINSILDKKRDLKLVKLFKRWIKNYSNVSELMEKDLGLFRICTRFILEMQ